MINRSLIRVKVLQVLYNYYHSGSMSPAAAEEILLGAMESDYKVYLYMCGLPLDMSDIARQMINIEEGKFSPDSGRLTLLGHLVDNPIVTHLKQDQEFVVRRMATSLYHRSELTEYHEQVLGHLLSPESGLFIEDPESFEAMRKIYRTLYGDYYRQSDQVYDLLENADAYITDADLPVIFSFVTKFYNGLSEEKSVSDLLRPKFVSKGDADFGPTLLRKTIEHNKEYRESISDYFKDWDADRVSDIDYLLLQMALAEAVHFPTIATTVTINEYLNLAHAFSSDNSYVFINGILFKLFEDLKEQGKILGN